MTDCVIDASVDIKLFVVEPQSSQAHALFANLTRERPARFLRARPLLC